jgi:hypothetical protein
MISGIIFEFGARQNLFFDIMDWCYVGSHLNLLTLAMLVPSYICCSP